jgi:hypothetical protein
LRPNRAPGLTPPLALPIIKPCSTPTSKRKSTEAPSFSIGKRVRKEAGELSYDDLATFVKDSLNQRKVQMLSLICQMRDLEKGPLEIHGMCVALYADVYPYEKCTEPARKFMRRTRANYLKNDKIATIRKEGSGGHNAITMNEDLRKVVKAEALKEGGSVRSIARALAGVGIVIGRTRVNNEMTGNYRDTLEVLLEYKKARTVCFLTEQMMIDRYNFAVMWTSARFYSPTGGYCAKPDKRSAKFLNMIKDWLFSDEKSFHTFGSNAKRPPKPCLRRRQLVGKDQAGHVH